jgi:hypothetical protein
MSILIWRKKLAKIKCELYTLYIYTDICEVYTLELFQKITRTLKF